MQKYVDIIANAYSGYASYLWHEITHPGIHNYFYWLIAVSLFFMALEWLSPWRKGQSKFRQDFWLDAFYMFFNFFIFSLIIYNAASDVVVTAFNDAIQWVAGIDLQSMNPLRHWPTWAILITGFFVRDFVQWWTHRLLHRSNRLWEFHKVHHSVEQMGFAAHLRYHWMETLVYRTIEYIPLALLGIGLYDFFIIHIFSLAIGHFNHSNITVPGYISGAIVGFLISIPVSMGFFDIPSVAAALNIPAWISMVGITIIFSIAIGPFMKYIFNSPEMHIWHHAMEIPEERKFGVNFGISLSLWDWLWGTAYIPYNGRDIELGFPGKEEFPDDFIHQAAHGFGHLPKD